MRSLMEKILSIFLLLCASFTALAQDTKVRKSIIAVELGVLGQKVQHQNEIDDQEFAEVDDSYILINKGFNLMWGREFFSTKIFSTTFKISGHYMEGKVTRDKEGFIDERGTKNHKSVLERHYLYGGDIAQTINFNTIMFKLRAQPFLELAVGRELSKTWLRYSNQNTGEAIEYYYLKSKGLHAYTKASLGMNFFGVNKLFSTFKIGFKKNKAIDQKIDVEKKYSFMGRDTAKSEDKNPQNFNTFEFWVGFGFQY